MALALAPLALGIGFAVVFQSGLPPNPEYYLQADLGTLLLLLSLLLCAWTFTLIALWERALRREERALADERERARAAHRRFLERLEHELKNPLTAMQAALANVAALLVGTQHQTSVASIKTQSERLGRLVKDLRKLTELESLPLERERVDVGQMLRDAVDLGQPHSSPNSDRLVLNLPRAWPPPPVMGDRDLLFLAIHNLIENALKFTDHGQIIEVRAFEDRDEVVIEVADTGRGVPTDELPHLFEELYRGQAARGVPGSGLGLALVKAIVERHGGTVAAHSRVGEGTLFRLRLPQG